jgi:sec-independent protein translocase protein TatA
MGGPELVIVGIVAIAVIFGAKKIPEMARSIGRAQGEFKKGLKEGVVDEEPAAAKAEDTPPPPPPPPPTAL